MNETCNKLAIGSCCKKFKEVLVFNVYAIGGHFRQKSFVKIGIAKDLRSRLKNIQTGCPFGLVIFNAVEVGYDPLGVEKDIHRLLHEYRLYGEWFELNEHTDELIKHYFIALIHTTGAQESQFKRG